MVSKNFDVYAACILHPDDVIELLYTYQKQEDAIACAEAYAELKSTQDAWLALGYNNEDKRPRIKILSLVVRPNFEPGKHTLGLRLVGAVKGDFSDL